MPDSILPDSTRLKFGVGQPVPRNEDPVLLQGRGRYTDDIDLPGQLYAVMIRSPYAHGVIYGIDTEAAKAVPGVLGDRPAVLARQIGQQRQQESAHPPAQLGVDGHLSRDPTRAARPAS